ncbi:hypothetical protein BCR42DRAFT_217860 [Absidia repens]|uniref:Uncharacterized protein n=1 Tax=Absidia repens TaxID=90262 RepID=A0A1X2IPG2_9FUNG|nr:hypothetical protein BCR42DRAFT_217860 [Absidia repens]
MQDWKSLPRDQLTIRLMALSERQQYLVTELENKQNQLDRSYQRIQHLKKRKRCSSNRDGETDTTALDSSSRTKRKRSSSRTGDASSAKKLDKQPAIDIDSGDDTADEDDALLVTALTPYNVHTSTYTQQNEQSSSSSGSGSSSQGSTGVDQMNVSEHTGPSMTQPSPSEFVLIRDTGTQHINDESWQQLISPFVDSDDTDNMQIVWTATNPISKATTRNAMSQHVIELSSDDDEPTRQD